MITAEVAFSLLKTNGHFNGTSAVIKLPPSRHTKPRRASEQAAGSLRGYVLLTTLKTLADESSEEIDEGENRGGKEAAWHCFHFCIQKRWTCPPPCLNSRGYDRSSDRDVVLLQGWMAFFFFYVSFLIQKRGESKNKAIVVGLFLLKLNFYHEWLRTGMIRVNHCSSNFLQLNIQKRSDAVWIKCSGWKTI